MLSSNNELYTSKDLVSMLAIPRQTIERTLPDTGFYLLRGENGHKVKAYPLSVLPDDIKRAVIAVELDAQPETSLEYATRMLPEPRVPLQDWQLEIRNARMLVLDYVRGGKSALGGISKAERDFVARVNAGGLSAEMAKVIDCAVAKKRAGGLSYGTLRGWRKLYNTGGPDALAPVGGLPARMPGWLDTFLPAYRAPGKPSIKLVYERLTADGVDLPDLRTVQRWVRRMGMVEANKGRMGMLELKKYRIHSMRKTDTLLPTDIFTADGYSAKFYVQNPYNDRLLKPELVTIMDVATRMVVGFAAGLAENRFNTLAALKDAVGKCGVPAIFYADNGPGFKNKMLKDPVTGLMLNLGISDKNSLPGRAWSRGLIERGQASIWSKHASLLPA